MGGGPRQSLVILSGGDRVPWRATRACAASIIMSCVMRLPKAFQERHPIGGVRARPFQPGGNSLEAPCAATAAAHLQRQRNGADLSPRARTLAAGDFGLRRSGHCGTEPGSIITGRRYDGGALAGPGRVCVGGGGQDGRQEHASRHGRAVLHGDNDASKFKVSTTAAKVKFHLTLSGTRSLACVLRMACVDGSVKTPRGIVWILVDSDLARPRAAAAGARLSRSIAHSANHAAKGLFCQ